MKPPSRGQRAPSELPWFSGLSTGPHGSPQVPIVWGISATIERFNQAMGQTQGRTTYPPVVVLPTSGAGIRVAQG